MKKKSMVWFLKDKEEILNFDLYLQHILSYGKTEDIKILFHSYSLKTIKQAFNRIKKFLPENVKTFWEINLESSK